MNLDLMAAISLIVIISLFAVLIRFINNLTRTLRNTGTNLHEALRVTTEIRMHCERVETGITAMNTNLYGVAAGLSNVGNAAESRAAQMSSAPDAHE